MALNLNTNEAQNENENKKTPPVIFTSRWKTKLGILTAKIYLKINVSREPFWSLVLRVSITFISTFEVIYERWAMNYASLREFGQLEQYWRRERTLGQLKLVKISVSNNGGVKGFGSKKWPVRMECL